MQRALTHSEQIEIYRVELDNGVIGYGENMGDDPATSIGLLDKIRLPSCRTTASVWHSDVPV